MGFILIDLKKRKESKQLRKLSRETIEIFDKWVADYPNDGTPPNEEECLELSRTKSDELYDRFCVEAMKLWRVKDAAEEEKKSVRMRLILKNRKLFQRFSQAVEALQDEAAEIMRFCVTSLETQKKEVMTMLPLGMQGLKEEFEEFSDSMKNYVDNTFPGGVKALDSYDDTLPDDVPSFSKFLDMVKQEEKNLREADKEAVPAALEMIKMESKEMFKTKINEAIQDAVKAIEEDLSDDVLPYLDETSMSALRKELIASANEYGASRLDK
jgi:hypothetical protein